MSRISIDVTPEQHQRLKAIAALQGQTIKDFVLARTLGALEPDSEEETALAELERLLEQRIANARENGPGSRSVDEIFGEAYQANDGAPSHG
ncbi:MAG: antitoxin [Cyanobacteria bacterium J06648_11]